MKKQPDSTPSASASETNAGRTSPKVCVGISTFRQHETVVALIEHALAIEDAPFDHVLVFDCMGHGRLQAEAESRGWANVTVIDADSNIGNAANLHQRLLWAVEHGYDYLYASNHDGQVNGGTIKTMLEVASADSTVGAVFPGRFVPTRNAYDVTGTQRLPLPFKGTDALGDEPIAVRWGSSNGVLYNTVPASEGVLPWSDLFMGWEDLGYGWQLENAGWKQFIATGAKFVDDREYTSHVGGKLTVSDKPTWYEYYSPRNLILVARRTEQPLDVKLVVAARIGLMGVMALAFKNKKRERLRYLARGVRDGLRGVAGKSEIP